MFDGPAAPRPPTRRTYVPPPEAPPPPGPSAARTEQWPEALYPDDGRYAPPDQGRYAPPGQGGYGAPGWGPDGPPPRGDRAGARRPGRRPDAASGGRGGERSSRSGGSGLPLGLGALVGIVGLGCFVAGLVFLPWFVVSDPVLGDQEVRLADIRSSFSVAETDPDDLAPGPETEATVPEGIPTPGEVGEVAEDQVRDAAASAAASALDEGKARYLELYTGQLWIVAAGAAALAVLFSTILSPRSFALSLLLGFRRAAGAVTVLAGVAHGAALWVVFSGRGAPDPAWGVWLGVGGLAGVLLACIIGPKD